MRNCILIWFLLLLSAGKVFLIYSFCIFPTIHETSYNIFGNLVCRWLVSHGLRLAALCVLESSEVTDTFGEVVECALACGKALAIEKLCEQKLLEKPAAEVPGYNASAYKQLVAAMRKMKELELPGIAQLEGDQDNPISVLMALRPNQIFI